MEHTNIFTVRRTELPQEKPINWERDFPQVFNPTCGSIEFSRDRRRRLTTSEKEERRVRRAAEKAAEIDSFVIGLCTGCAIFAAVTGILLVMLGGL